MTHKLSNAERFIAAYNTIDSTLRSMYGFKRSMTFSDVIRRSVLLNSVVRKYEDELIDFGRLRNAIIHKSNPNYVIAEPHSDVVEKMEGLAKLISTPPLALDRISKEEVLCIKPEITAKQAIILMARSGYSNLPVYEQEQLTGILSGQRLLDVIGTQIIEGKDINAYIDKTTVGEIISQIENERYFSVVDEKITIESVLNLFENNKKLILVLITKGGSLKYPPLGIITITDIVEMQKIIDIY